MRVLGWLVAAALNVLAIIAVALIIVHGGWWWLLVIPIAAVLYSASTLADALYMTKPERNQT